MNIYILKKEKKKKKSKEKKKKGVNDRNLLSPSR